MRKICCIGIPVYKVVPGTSEIASFENALRLLKGYEVFLFCPSDLDVTNYIKILETYSEIRYDIMRFKSHFFSSLDGYNRLLLSVEFYKRFEAFDYILVYQLDAWIFKNELEYWCNMDYDYIGAPWFEGLHLATETAKFAGVGNGGFSLRKIRAHIKVLKSFKYITPVSKLWSTFVEEINLRSVIRLVLDLTIRNNFLYVFNDFNFQEDIFWGKIAFKRFTWYRVPPEDVALKFSMEVNAPLLYKMNNNNLPFGCHAWEKYHHDFWREFITVEN